MICNECGKEYQIGEWPYCPHGWAVSHPPFIPWVDECVSGEAVEISNLAQWNRLMKENNCDLKDEPTKGDLNARKDRIMEQQRIINEYQSQS